jgi:hypothetical protein
VSVGNIAQLIVPADGFGSPLGMLADWTRGRLFGFCLRGMRSYSLSMVTQSPILSVDTQPWGSATSIAGPEDIDPITGNIIAAWIQGNGSPIRKIDPVTLTLIASYGASTPFPSYPTSITYPQQIICVTCGTLANPNALVGYALIKENQFSGHVAALRVSDQFTQAGFYGNVVSGSTDNRGNFCRGASGSSGASIFGSWAGTAPTPTIPLYKVAIAPGAELYNPASWPTTNPYITSSTVGTIAAASVDATWSNLECSQIGYDQSDGNVLMTVSTNDSVANKKYLIKLNVSNAAVMWATAVSTTGSISNLDRGLYSGGIAPIINSGSEAWTVDTSDGTHTALAIGGINTSTSAAFNSFAGVNSGLYVWQGTYNQAASANSPAPVSGTPTSFTGPALIALFFTPPVSNAAVGIGDLFFAPSGDEFIDLRTESNRRKFLTVDGATEFLGDEGSLPLGAVPPIFLTISAGETANDFGVNRGSGGSFTRAGPDLAAWGGSIPPCGPYNLPITVNPNTPQGADPEIRLAVSDDGGRTFSLLQKWRSMGKIGQYRKRLRWMKMGMFRQRQIRLEVTDPVRRNIIGIYMDTSEGLDW